MVDEEVKTEQEEQNDGAPIEDFQTANQDPSEDAAPAESDEFEADDEDEDDSEDE